MDALSRVRSGSFASTSGRQAFPNGSFAGDSSSAAQPLRSPRPMLATANRNRNFTVTAELQSRSTWGNASRDRGNSGGGSPLPPPSSVAAPSAGFTTASPAGQFTTQRPITTYPSRSFAALPLPLPEQRPMEEPPEDIAIAALSRAAEHAVVLEGAIQKIHYRSSETAYTVLRLSVAPEFLGELPPPDVNSPATAAAAAAAARARGRRPAATQQDPSRTRKRVITVVGTMPQVCVGQSLRLSGSWMTHPQYGQQLKAATYEELSFEVDSDMVTYLASGILPGVGREFASRMVALWSNEVVAMLNSPNAAIELTQCKGIGASKAKKMKDAWDAGRGARIGSEFLRKAGVPAAMAQKVAEQYASRTQAVVIADPYAALGVHGLPLSTMDRVAAVMGAPADLVSRAAAAMERCLIATAEREGHTFLPWSKLERETRKLLEDLGKQHGNPWPRADLLYLVGQHMHQAGLLVAEPSSSGAALPPPAEQGLSSTVQHSTASVLSADTAASSTASVDVPWEAISEETLSAVKQRLPGVSALQMSAMCDTHGAQLPAVLDLSFLEAIVELKKCKRIGPKTAEKVKTLWDGSSPSAAAAAAAVAAPMVTTSGTPFGFKLADLEASPPALPFEWGAGVRCYLPRLHAAEVAVAEAAGEKAAMARTSSASRLTRIRKWIKENQTSNGVELSQGQCAAIQAASDAPLLVITGGPGCGKTTVVQAIVKLWSAQGKLVHICAPTGRAAQRMGAIQGIEPSTIHRLLRYQPRGSGTNSSSTNMQGGGDDMHAGGRFEFGPSNKLISDAVLVDEASMLSLPLAAALMQALKTKTQLILVGDADQLPPIGPGGVLHSLIASGLAPVVDLREVFRQAAASAIITSALSVRHGDVPRLRSAAPTADALLNAGTDALIVRASDPDSVPEKVYETVGALAAHKDFAEADLQVITPMKKGPTGSVALNLRLQNLLNPPARDKPEVPRGNHGAASAWTNGAERVFRVGDRVLQLVNDYDKEVFNGDQGYIVEASVKDRRVVVNFPQIGGRSGTTNGTDNGTNGSSTNSLDGLRVYEGVELAQLELAYAVTVHKAQGGEAKHVVMALSPQHGRMLTRRLLYTGLTRAKDLLVVVAPEESSEEPDPLATAVRHKESDVRRSFLTERLEQEIERRVLTVRTPEVYSNEEEILHGTVDGTADGATAAAAHISEVLQNQETENLSSQQRISDSVGDSASTDGREIAVVSSNIVEARSLCSDLNIVNGDAEAVVSALKTALAQEHATLVQAPIVYAHLDKLRALCGKHELGSLPPLAHTLRLAPLLLVASPQYFDRGLALADRFGPLPDQAQGMLQNQDGLVDQLRRVMGAAQ